MRLSKAFLTVLLVGASLSADLMAQSAPADGKSSSAAPTTPAPSDKKGSDKKGADKKATDKDKKGSESTPAPAAPASAALPPAAGTPPPSPALPSQGAGVAPAPAPKPPASEAGTAEAGKMDAATYTVRLRDLEQRIDELKEQIRRSHTRLSLLSDQVLSGNVGGATAEITLVNEMSSVYRLKQATVLLDGSVQYNKQDDTGGLTGQKEFPIFSGAIKPGDHTIQVKLVFRGHGYGVFAYAEGLKFTVPGDFSFTVQPGKTAEIKIIAFEKGGVTTPLEKRPTYRFQQKMRASGGSGAKGTGGR